MKQNGGRFESRSLVTRKRGRVQPVEWMVFTPVCPVHGGHLRSQHTWPHVQSCCLVQSGLLSDEWQCTGNEKQCEAVAVFTWPIRLAGRPKRAVSHERDDGLLFWWPTATRLSDRQMAKLLLIRQQRDHPPTQIDFGGGGLMQMISASPP